MKNKADLTFINYLKSLENALSGINRIIADSQQHEELSNQQVALVEQIHNKLYWPGIVTFDKKNLDAGELKVINF